ncbi:hypothetical protein [Methyloradius palustris]|uniref:Uncharacterized protein n=1 Tax=Methyloradius palustris TaxID=2778876 RepID=A0A8D5G171_9PROT|nr:hypothetical protein [Methyloradius palustris]BCM25490.1 hypothetical protein ZMTM_17490 [Methyloradius palustris]
MATQFQFQADEEEVLELAFSAAEFMVTHEFIPTVPHEEIRAKHIALIEAFHELQKCGYPDKYDNYFNRLATAYKHGLPELTEEE